MRRTWLQRRLKDPQYAFLFDAPPRDEWVAIDCEATGFDVARDRLLAVEAVRIVGNRLLTSERLQLRLQPEAGAARAPVGQAAPSPPDPASALPPAEAMRRLLAYIGSRPLVGYFLDFDVEMLDREIRPLLGIGLPQPRLEVSSMYYEWRNRHLPPPERGGNIDLRFATLVGRLGLPGGGGFGNAVLAGLAFLKLKGLLEAG